jgi:hypothetical protein
MVPNKVVLNRLFSASHLLPDEVVFLVQVNAEIIASSAHELIGTFKRILKDLSIVPIDYFF